MRIYCKRHEALLSPEPSGYGPPTAWRCGGAETERLTIFHLLGSGIDPTDARLAGVAVVTSKDTTRLIAFPTLESVDA